MYSSLIIIFNLRQKYPGAVQTSLVFFLIYYLTINFCVNLFDFFWNYMAQGITYRHDADFVSSFSYKSH